MDIYTLIVAGHVIGTILGAGGATVAELQIAKALKDGKVVTDERALLHVNYTMIRVGMAIMVLSVIGMFWYTLSNGQTYLLTNEKLWIKDVMLIMVFINAVMLQKHWVPLWLGASISFTSWWGATLLGLAGSLPYSFTTYLIGYVIAIFVMAGILHGMRNIHLFLRNKKHLYVVRTLILVVVAFVTYRLIEGVVSDEMRPEQITQEEILATREFSATVEYVVPGGSHTVAFTIHTNEEDIISHVTAFDVTDPDHQDNVDRFAEAVTVVVAGKKLDELDSVDRVGTSSLTTDAFNDALVEIRSQ